MSKSTASKKYESRASDSEVMAQLKTTRRVHLDALARFDAEEESRAESRAFLVSAVRDLEAEIDGATP